MEVAPAVEHHPPDLHPHDQALVGQALQHGLGERVRGPGRRDDAQPLGVVAEVRGEADPFRAVAVVDAHEHATADDVVVGREHPEARSLPGRLVPHDVVAHPEEGDHDEEQHGSDRPQPIGALRGEGGGPVAGRLVHVATVVRAAMLERMGEAGDELWEAHATWWQEGFTQGADPEYEEQILPLAARHLHGTRRVLDVGCGEGQLARLAGTLGAVAVGVDPTAAQIVEAQARGGGATYGRAGASSLPFRSGSFDAVVACLVFEHIVEVDAAIAEVSRVLTAGGRFLFFLNHPLLQTPNSGWIDDQVLDPPEQYWRIGPYLVEDETIEEVEKGVFIPFIHRPLSRYVNALAEVGLTLERMEEPAPPPGFLARAAEYEAAASIPRLLFLRCAKGTT